jgi:hypothetical protein
MSELDLAALLDRLAADGGHRGVLVVIRGWKGGPWAISFRYRGKTRSVEGRKLGVALRRLLRVVESAG